MLHFLFPADPLDPRSIDAHFDEQRVELRRVGFSCSLVPDAAFEAPAALRGIPAGASVVYRGWMVDGRQYRNLVEAIILSGGVPCTSLEAYLLAHHLPNWYPRIADLTAETIVLSETADLAAELRKLPWPGFFLKDYVKSLKTSTGSLVTDPAAAPRVVEEMRRFRGSIEGGICVRRFEAFVANTEARYFVLAGRPYSAQGESVPGIVHSVAERISSPFFSVDVAETEDGRMRVVEIGDGQVSDLVGWSPAEFAGIWPQPLPG